LNALVQRKKLARTSSTPGKTRLIHFFDIEVGNTELRFVDLPGYGWAKVSRTERKSWERLVESYLADRPVLRAAMLLQDLRREISEDEGLLLDWLGERGVPAMMVLTKCDKLKPMRRKERVRKLRKSLETDPVEVLATSSQSGEGIDLLWKAIYRRLQDEGA
jgi:GTP-binding protein